MMIVVVVVGEGRLEYTAGVLLVIIISKLLIADFIIISSSNII